MVTIYEHTSKEITMNLKPIIITIFVLLMCGTASAAWANASYTYAKDITLHGADTQLSNYPYLVSVAKEPGMQTDYDDLIFYDQPVSQDGNLIDFEIETYNSTTATVWLNITTLPTAGKTISMYYGNPSASSTQNPPAVWDGDYVGVWHMSDNVTTDYAWNNYKVPDGVITADASTNYTIVEPNVLYEDGMFKMWVHIDYEGATSLAYYTSIDGYNWTCVDPHVINESCWCPSIYKNETTGDYWLYNGNASTNKEDLYIGTNETNFEIDTWGCWSAADAGGTQGGNSHIWKENISDWYMIFEYTGPGWIGKYATSNNGKDWTFHSQIVVSGFGSNGLCGPCVWKNNGTYYMVFHGNKGNDGGIPSDIYVATSTDRQNWIYQPGFEITREYDWEGVGNSEGQVGDPSIVEYNGEAYIFYAARHSQTSNDAANPHRIGLVHLNESLEELANHINAGTSSGPIITDSTGQNDGWLDGSANTVSSIIGNAVNFSNDAVQIPSSGFYQSGTISFWQNTSTLSSEQIAFSGNENVADSSNYSIFMGRRINNTAMAKMHNSIDTISELVTADDTILADSVQFLTYTSNGSHTKCFLNGSEIPLTVTSGSNSGDWFADIPNINKYGIGSLKRGTQELMPFEGVIDEVELSNIDRSADWINLSHQMVVDSSYVTFGAEETASGDVNSIVLGANKYGMLRKSVTSAQSFSTIAGEFSHDVCFTWWDSTNDRWESYYSGDSYNSAKSVPEYDSYFVLMDGTGETVSCSVAAAENVDIPIGWSSTYLRESASKTLSEIKTDMGSNCADIYAWDHTASGTGAWTNTGTFSVSPNQGILVDASSGFTWDGSVS